MAASIWSMVVSGVLGILVLCGGVRPRGAAVRGRQRAAGGVENLSEGMSYMKKYGWMPPVNPEAAELITEMDMRSSIARMQRFFHLTPTGQMDAITLEKMQTPRCGVPDVNVRSNRFRPNRYANDPNLKWRTNELTYSFENYTPDMRRSEVIDSIEQALKVWSDVTPLKFTEISSYDTADLEISFAAREHGDTYSFDGQGGTLAHAFFPGPGIGGDAHFDDDEQFLYNTDVNGIDLFTVAAHELGHSLGLGHSEVPDALMAPFYQGYNPDFQLNYDDIYGIQSLYGSNPDPPRPGQPGRGDPDVAAATMRPAYRPQATIETPASVGPTQDPVCEVKFDAIANIRSELFMFKGDEMWRIQSDGTPYEGYPNKINIFWNEPVDITAAFESRDGLIYFIKGNEYLEYDGLDLTHYYPKPITDFGLPSSISVDAVLPWPQEGKLFFFFENQVWRYNEFTRSIDEGFPMNIKEFWGHDVGNDLGAAFRFQDYSYFIKSKRFWRYDEVNKTISDGYPKNFGVEWLGCTPPDDEGATGGSSRTIGSTFAIPLFTVIILWVTL